MIIEIPKLRPDGEWFEGEEDASILDVGGDAGMRTPNPIRYRLFAQPVSGKLVVRGEIEVGVEFRCVRCTDFFSTTVRESSFLRDYEISGGVETVDVTPDIREDVLLSLPSHPVCRDDCRGLCPHCGCNLNREPCSCRPPEDARWGALDGLDVRRVPPAGS